MLSDVFVCLHHGNGGGIHEKMWCKKAANEDAVGTSYELFLLENLDAGFCFSGIQDVDRAIVCNGDPSGAAIRR